jgi:heme exporter protein A
MPKVDPIIEVKGLVKKFGFKTVLRKVDLSLEKGDFLALFGHNGAGKTTLIRILCSLMRPTSGEIHIAGLDPHYDRETLCKNIGVISHRTFLYQNLSAFENLRFYGRMYDVSDLKDRCEALLDLVGLTTYRSDPVNTFSRGMQQRLSVARAIIHDPQILFLDEPYTGLDQHGAEDLKKLLERFRTQRKTILMTSHNIDRGLELCNHSAILKSGRLVFKEDISRIQKDDFKQLYLDLTGKNALSAGVSS